MDNKKRCNANAMRGKDFCFTHNPATHEALIEASMKGGRAPKRERRNLGLIKKKPKGPDDVCKLLSATLTELSKGKIDEKTANCIAFMANNLLRAWKLKEDEDIRDSY